MQHRLVLFGNAILAVVEEPYDACRLLTVTAPVLPGFQPDWPALEAELTQSGPIPEAS